MNEQREESTWEPVNLPKTDEERERMSAAFYRHLEESMTEARPQIEDRKLLGRLSSALARFLKR